MQNWISVVKMMERNCVGSITQCVGFITHRPKTGPAVPKSRSVGPEQPAAGGGDQLRPTQPQALPRRLKPVTAPLTTVNVVSQTRFST